MGSKGEVDGRRSPFNLGMKGSEVRLLVTVMFRNIDSALWSQQLEAPATEGFDECYCLRNHMSLHRGTLRSLVYLLPAPFKNARASRVCLFYVLRHAPPSMKALRSSVEGESPAVKAAARDDDERMMKSLEGAYLSCDPLAPGLRGAYYEPCKCQR